MAALTWTLFIPFSQIRKAAIPISTKSVVQTGPKIQLGGFQAGLLMVAYQVGIDGMVNREPMNPAARQTITDKVNLAIFMIISLLKRCPNYSSLISASQVLLFILKYT